MCLVCLDRDGQDQANGEDQDDTEDAPVGVVAAGGLRLADLQEDAVHERRQERDGAAGGRVQAEDFTFTTCGDDTAEERTGCRLGRADEDAEQQAKAPEDDRAVRVEEEDAQAENDHRSEREDNDLFRANLVVESAEADGS